MFDPNDKKFINDMKYNEPGKLPEKKESVTLMFDPTKPYCRRDGEPAKIVYTLKSSKHLIVTDTPAVLSDEEIYYSVYADGRVYKEWNDSNLDLINIPEKIEGWVNVYKDNISINAAPGWLYDTKEQADRVASVGRIACIKVSFTEGEGLDK